MAEIYLAQLPVLTFDAIGQQVVDNLRELIDLKFPVLPSYQEDSASIQFIRYLLESEDECKVMKELCKDWLRQRNARLTASEGLTLDSPRHPHPHQRRRSSVSGAVTCQGPPRQRLCGCTLARTSESGSPT